MAMNLTDGQQAERKLLVTCVNVGDSVSAGSGTPKWEIVGSGVEDSSIEFNPDIETKTDILGVTSTKINKLETSQSLEPMTVKGGSDLQEKLLGQLRDQKLSEMMMYEVMIITAFIGTSSAYEAEVHKNCTITPQSLGGSSTVDMPISINFSNNKILGTVNDYKGNITFSPAA